MGRDELMQLSPQFLSRMVLGVVGYDVLFSGKGMMNETLCSLWILMLPLLLYPLFSFASIVFEHVRLFPRLPDIVLRPFT